MIRRIMNISEQSDVNMKYILLLARTKCMQTIHRSMLSVCLLTNKQTIKHTESFCVYSNDHANI